MEIRISDKRSGRFIVDNCILDEYGSKLGSTGLALYMALCRHVSNDTQKCWPSVETLRLKTGMDKHTISEAGKKLVDLRLISKKLEGRCMSYTLLEPLGKSATMGKSAPSTVADFPPTNAEMPNQTNAEMPIPRNELNEHKEGTKERTNKIYNRKLERNENGLPVFTVS